MTQFSKFEIRLYPKMAKFDITDIVMNLTLQPGIEHSPIGHTYTVLLTSSLIRPSYTKRATIFEKVF